MPSDMFVILIMGLMDYTGISILYYHVSVSLLVLFHNTRVVAVIVLIIIT